MYPRWGWWYFGGHQVLSVPDSAKSDISSYVRYRSPSYEEYDTGVRPNQTRGTASNSQATDSTTVNGGGIGD